MNTIRPKSFFAGILAAIVILLGSALYESGFIGEELYLKIISVAQSSDDFENETAKIHFIDVGQGESVLIESFGKNVLIDTGEIGFGNTVAGYLRANGVYSIDLLLITHPHSDHMGCAEDIIEKFPVGKVIMPEIPAEYIPTLSFYEGFLREMKRRDIPLSYAENGEIIELSGGKLELFVPNGNFGDNLNNYSVVSKYTFGEAEFLFTGDIEAEGEKALLDAGADVSCDVYDAAHHGSSTSNSDDFLDAAKPDYAAVSCGYNNDYGHPHKEIKAAFKERGIKYFRTDYDGNIIFSTDGKEISVFLSK